MKDAFEYAANLWTQTITSSVPIVIHARLRKTSESLATTNTYYSRNFVNAPLQNVDYPCALANSFAGENTRTEVPDMDITVSTNEALQSWDDDVKGVWYLGTDGLTNSYDPFEGPQYDFVTVMFHEIGHGLLGSISTTPVTFTNGVPYSQTLLNTIFNQFIGNCASGTLMTEMQSPSATIGYMVSGYPIVLNNGDVIYNYPCWLGSGDPPCDFNLKI